MYLVTADNECPDHHTVRACLRGGRVTVVSGPTIPERQKIDQVYKQNFTRWGNPTTQENLINVRLHSKDLETKLAWEGGFPYLECLQGKKLTPLLG